MARKKTILESQCSKDERVRPTKAEFLGFTFYKRSQVRKCVPAKERKKRLNTKMKKLLKRKQAVTRAPAITLTRVNQNVRGWIDYIKIGSIKTFHDESGQRIRHKIR